MDNKNKAARKARELTSQLEEEDLWDLDDDSEDSEDTSAAENSTPLEENEPEEKIEPSAEEEPDEEVIEEIAETGDLFEDHEKPETEEEESEAEILADEEFESEEEELKIEDELESEEIPDAEETTEEEEEPEEEAVEESDGEPTEETADEPVANSTYDDPTQTPEEAAQEAAAKLIKKAGVSTMEKVALGAVAVLFLGLAIWGYAFLRGQNNLGKIEVDLDFPIKGKYATVSDFKTFWQGTQDSSGIKLGAKVIPAASITLADDHDGSGALRIYFRNEDKTSVGDPITLSFSNGQFNNGEKTIEVTATDGFHQEGDFNAYVLDRSLAWRVQVLEASSSNASGSEFEQIIETLVEPVRR